MDILNTKIKSILTEKNTKILPSNIKKDVNILGVTGTYEGQQPSGTISITENGTVDVSNYASADVNVQGSSSTNNAKIIPKTNNYYNIYQYIQNVDDNYDISSTTILRSGFSNFSSLLKAPTMSTSQITDAQNLFLNCESLVDVPVYDWSSLSAHRNYNMYSGCTSLSNDSLNNILQSCIGMTGVDTKTLKYIGLSSTQATTCTGLSNWSACQSAGWTTGY